jgi:hypothetical protein
MVSRTLIIAGAVAFGIVHATLPAWAGGPGDTPPSCVVANPPGGATAVRGTVAVGVQNAAAPANTDVDFVLRLERGGALAFFRTSVNMQVFAASNESILCHLLKDSTSPGATGLRAAIRTAFGFSPEASFWLVERSVSKAEIQGSTGQWLCNDTYTDSSLTPTCAAPRGASMADVLIYVK